MDFDDYRPKVEALRSRTKEQVDAIRRDQAKYSTRYRDAQMASVVSKARKDAERLRADYVASRTQRRDALTRDLFGLPAGSTPNDVMLWRDARQRVAQLTREEAAREIQESSRLGDHTMVRAVAERAFTNGWKDLMASFVDNEGAAASAAFTATQLSQLEEIPRADGFTDNVAFHVPSPTELRSYSRRDVDKLAEEADEEASAP